MLYEGSSVKLECGRGGRRRRVRRGGGERRGRFEEVGIADERHKPVRSIVCRYLEREVKY